MNMREEDIPEVREESFRYSGAETAIQRVRHHQFGGCRRECFLEVWINRLRKRSKQLVNEIINKRIAEGSTGRV